MQEKFSYRYLGRLVIAASCAVAANADADTYYGKETKETGSFPNEVCTWYTDEACTTKTSIDGLKDGQVNPTANDGHTYVVLSAQYLRYAYQAPVGTKFLFDTTGRIFLKGSGSSAHTPELDWGSATIRNMSAVSAVWVYAKWNGTYTFEEGGRWEFYTDSGNHYDLQGHELAGRFIAPRTALISLESGYRAEYNDTARSRLHYGLTGDFTEFEGKFNTERPGGAAGRSYEYCHVLVSLESESAFGASDMECADYITLKRDNWLRIDPAVTQYATKGITLSLADSERAALQVDDGKFLTLTAPLYGATGTLEKRGKGTLSLSSPMQVKNIRVAEGTLEFGAGATFAEGTKITVAEGAGISYGTAPENVTIVMEDGAVRVQPTVSVEVSVSDDGTLTVPEPVSLSSGYSPTAGVIPVVLSQAIPIPLNASNRWAVATVSGGQFKASDFRDDSPKTLNLPKTWFEVETDSETGLQTVYLAARPAILFDYNEEKRSSTNIDVATNYTDGQAPSKGKDYYFTYPSGSVHRPGGGNHVNNKTFAGETISVSGSYITDYSVCQTFHNMTLFADSGIQTCWAKAAPAEVRNHHTLRGDLTVDASADDESPAWIRTHGNGEDSVILEMDLKGSGVLKLDSQVTLYEDDPKCEKRAMGIYGNNSGFTGRLRLNGLATSAPMRFAFTNATAFGGSPEMMDKFGVRFSPKITEPNGFFLAAEDSVVLDVANRGWIGTSVTLCAAEGKRFVFAPPSFVLMEASSTLAIDGPGAVALGCAPTWWRDTAIRKIHVTGGSVMAVDGTSYDGMALEFAEGAGIALDLTPASEGAATYGVRPDSITAAGRIPVKPFAENGKRLHLDGVVELTVCTVPAEHADLSETLDPQSVRGVRCLGMTKVTLDDGNVCYRVKYGPYGTIISVK